MQYSSIQLQWDPTGARCSSNGIPRETGPAQNPPTLWGMSGLENDLLHLTSSASGRRAPLPHAPFPGFGGGVPRRARWSLPDGL
eukprot:4225112-Pyramimonas_sp.AAC.1